MDLPCDVMAAADLIPRRVAFLSPRLTRRAFDLDQLTESGEDNLGEICFNIDGLGRLA